jgi:hypothetical protein
MRRIVRRPVEKKPASKSEEQTKADGDKPAQ